MELVIKGKNMDITEVIRDYIEQRLGKLGNHLTSITTVGVELTEEKTRSLHNRYVVQVTVDRKGTLLRAEQRAADVYTAIDSVAAVIARQIERYKGRLYGRKKPSSLREGLVPGGEPSKVVRTKRFPIKPMSVDEAIDQMELLGHDFFLFYNQDAAQFNVLYRRKDGNYGLIEPELG